MKKLYSLLIVKLCILFLLSLVAHKLLVYKGLFSHPSVLTESGLPKFLYSFSNFDGILYVKIAREGYHQFDQAFFPLFPLLIWVASHFFLGNSLLAGIFIANICFFIGLKFFYELLKKNYSQQVAFWSCVFLILLPTSFFFQSAYSESLFFLLIVMGLYWYFQKKRIFSILSFFFLGMTRIIGIVGSIPFVVELFYQQKHKSLSLKRALSIITPFLGLATYMAFLYVSTGDALAFFNAQPSFGSGRSTHLILLPQVMYRYFKILLTANRDFAYFVALLEIIFFLFTLCTSAKLFWNSHKKKHSFGVSLSIISFLMILIPSFTGTFLSMPRFAILCFSNYIVLSQIKSMHIKLSILIAFIVFQVALWIFFVQGYFVS